MNFNTCQTLLLVVGEEVKKINTDLKQEPSTIPWKLIRNLRNKIAHNYRGIDPNISFDIVRNYLSSLKEKLIAMLEKVEFEEDLLDKITRIPHYRHLKYLTK